MDNRTALLDAALILFAQYGYDAVGVQAIVDAASVTKPTLYHYFGSKHGLFEALVNEQGASLLDMTREVTLYDKNITQSIRDAVRGYFNYATEQPVFYRMLLSMWFAPPNSEYSGIVHRLLQEQHTLLEQMFLAAAADHGNIRGRHQQYAIGLKGLIDTYIGLSLQGFLDLQSEHFQYRIVHQFMHGIFS